MLSVVQGAVSNKMSTKGVLVGKIEEQINKYKTENAILSEKLLVYSSFTNVQKKAFMLGFAKDKRQIVISSSVPLAVKQ